MRSREEDEEWLTWRQIKATGQTIFCSICKSMRSANLIIADVTTLNFNLLFEIGYALGLNLPLIPIRDTTFIRDKVKFAQLGMLDTMGYLDFQNSEVLASGILKRKSVEAIPTPPANINRQQPLYVLKGPIDTDGAIRLMSLLKRSALRFRSYDSVETPRLSLHQARKQAASSIGIVANLLHPERECAAIHNGRCALIAGIAMASAKITLLLQEGEVAQPIDYRDVVQSYQTADQIERILEKPIKSMVIRLQEGVVGPTRPPRGLLQKLDLGDVAAENEIQALRSYFVATAQFNDAKRGHARLVVGTKGSGKTAVFYALRDSISNRRSHLVLDLKPEGHQFTKLREIVLSRLSPGLQEHTLVAFWNYILLCEMAQKIRDYEYSYAQHDEGRRTHFEQAMDVYGRQVPSGIGDFSERLLRQVDRLTARFGENRVPSTGGELTEILFRGEIRELDDALAAYLGRKEEVWVLVDNLDKGWPTRGATPEDILILRSLLVAARKLQRQFNKRDVNFNCLVFLRNDIYDYLLRETPDRGKDTAIILDWPDPEAFKDLILKRVTSSLGLTGTFEDVWRRLFAPTVGVEDSFNYIVGRTLMRPRDLLNFLHRAVEVAINRDHTVVEEDDIRKAQDIYSEDLLHSTSFEIHDVFPDITDPLYVFLECSRYLDKDDVTLRLMEAGMEEHKTPEALSLLLWFGFIGVNDPDKDQTRFSYQVRYNTDKLIASAKTGRNRFMVHPAFWEALECPE